MHYPLFTNYDAVRPVRQLSWHAQVALVYCTRRHTLDCKNHPLHRQHEYAQGCACHSSGKYSDPSTQEDAPVPIRPWLGIALSSSRGRVFSKGSDSGSPVRNWYPARRRCASSAIIARSTPSGTSTYTGTTSTPGILRVPPDPE